MTSKAIILAAGLGTRMRRSNAQAALTDQQEAAAEEGLKALFPIDRPFLDYSLTGLADAGYDSVCLVIGPGHGRVRDYYRSVSCERLTIEFAIQPQPLGTANALTAAAGFAGDDPVLVLNGDNHYPTDALRALRETAGDATIGFDHRSLVAKGNISADRIAAFSVIEQDDDGYLTKIVEKPDATAVAPPYADAWRTSLLISMNCWRFGPAVFEACREIEPSPRGEYEIPDAVMYTVREMGARYRVIRSTEGVLDLSTRDDVAGVRRRLQGVEVRL